MRRLLLVALVACLVLPRLSHAAAVVFTCSTARVTALDVGYLATTTCTSDGGDYAAGGVAVGTAATAAATGTALCGSSARIPVFVLSSLGSVSGAGGGNPTTFDLATYKLKMFEGSAAGTILAEKGVEAVTASTIVTFITLCQ